MKLAYDSGLLMQDVFSDHTNSLIQSTLWHFSIRWESHLDVMRGYGPHTPRAGTATKTYMAGSTLSTRP
jgi:hypothetical protein